MGIVARMLLLSTLLLAASTRVLEELDNDSCCESITLSSGGMGDFYQGERLGVFVRSGSSSSGRGIYTQNQGDNYLFYLSSKSVWMVGPNVGQDFGGVLNRDSGSCPENITLTGLTPGRKTGPWRPRVGLVDQHQTLMGSHVPGATTVMTVLYGVRLMVSDTAVLLTATLAPWM